MEQANAGAMLMMLLSGLLAAGLGAVMLAKPRLAAALLKPIGSSTPHSPTTVQNLAGGLLAVGLAWLFVFIAGVIPYPRARPLFIVVLSFVLAPAATIGFAVILFLAWRPRSRPRP